MGILRLLNAIERLVRWPARRALTRREGSYAPAEFLLRLAQEKPKTMRFVRLRGGHDYGFVFTFISASGCTIRTVCLADGLYDGRLPPIFAAFLDAAAKEHGRVVRDPIQVLETHANEFLDLVTAAVRPPQPILGVT